MAPAGQPGISRFPRPRWAAVGLSGEREPILAGLLLSWRLLLAEILWAALGRRRPRLSVRHAKKAVLGIRSLCASQGPVGEGPWNQSWNHKPARLGDIRDFPRPLQGHPRRQELRDAGSGYL
jgi:hypothetical protein